MRHIAKRILLFSHAFGLLAFRAAYAELPPHPDLEGFTPQATRELASTAAIGRIDLASGQVKVHVPADRGSHPSRPGMPLAEGDLIETGATQDSRARIVFENGDYVHVGPGSLVGVLRQGVSHVVQLWRGQAMAYAIPSIQARQAEFAVLTADGTLTLKVGKASVQAADGQTQVMVFDNAATFTDGEGATTLGMGQGLVVKANRHEFQAVAPALGLQLSIALSPEVPVVKAGLDAFRNEDLAAAKHRFEAVQAAFPYNGVAAYYLGVIELEQGRLSAAVNQWQSYTRIDPEGAREKAVPRHLTVLVGQQLKEEVQQALASEQQLSGLPPEPNSIAVHPLNNKGGPKYRAVGKGLTAMVISDIAQVPNLKVLEREKIQKLLDEIKLSEGGLVSEQTAVRSGRILRAEKLVIGDYLIEPRAEKPNEQD